MIERFLVPTVDALLQIEGLDRGTAEELFQVLSGAVGPCDVSTKCATWVRQCHHTPSKHEQILCACDDLLGGCGVEALPVEGEEHTDCGTRHCPPFSYVNFGDTYLTTLARDHENSAWVIASWGDLLEEYEQAHKLGSYAEYDEEPEQCYQCDGTSFTFDKTGERSAWICDSCDSCHLAGNDAGPSEDEDDG